MIGVAIIGCGYWGVNYVRVFNELKQSRVVALCDQREARLNELRPRFPDAKMVTRLEDVLAMDDVHAVAVCTTAATHHDVVAQCLAAGKHVLVEKPMTTLAGDAEHLNAMARERGLVLMVGHTFLYNNGVRKVKEYMDNGRLGRVYYLYARRTNLGPIRHDVNAVWDLATHDVAIFNYLLGAKPLWVSAVGAHVLHSGNGDSNGNGVESHAAQDVGFVSLAYPGGVVAHVHASWADPNKVREVVVVGSNERIVFNDVETIERVKVFEKAAYVEPDGTSFGEYHLHLRDGDIISPRVEPNEPLKSQCLHFLDCVERGAAPLTDARNGTDVVEVMEAIDRSMALHGAPVTVGAAERVPA
jgi:predicted dehydrogenase